MIKKIFTADDFGKYQQGDSIILNSNIKRISVMINRGKNFSILKSLKDKKIGLHADFKGENLLPFFLLIFRKKYIEKELDKQIKKFILTFGKKPTHLDSHRYLHLHPFVFPIFLKTCKKYQIPYLRAAKHGVVKINNLTSLIIHIFTKLNYLLYKKQIKDFIIADYLLSLDWYKNLNFKLPDGTIKIIFHPENDIKLLKKLQNNNELITDN